MKNLYFIALFFLLASGAYSQTITKNFEELTYMQDSIGVSSSGGEVVVIQDAKLEQIITNYSNAFKRKPDKIYRVQIYFGIGRDGRFKAQNIKDGFERDHPGIPAYLIFEEPYFKIKVGDFDTKLDAERLKSQLIESYETIFITEDIDE